MAKSVGHILRHCLGGLAAGPVVEGQADQNLLERFVRQQDEAAFAALLERHGPMVLGVGRRALADEHLAEDVFQATFLVLARRAGSIRKRPSLGSWLHGVALRLARKARAEATRAGRGDVRPGPDTPPGPAAEASWREVRQILDEELQRLPERYRLPLVLCYLEGWTRDEVAAALGWTPGRLKGLLERGRERLRGRLIRRGLAPAAAGTALLADTALAALVPPFLAGATRRAALRLAAGELLRACGVSERVLQLTEGGLGIMGAKKGMLFLGLTLALGALGIGAGLLAQRPDPAAAPGRAKGVAAATPPAPQPKPRIERSPHGEALDLVFQSQAAKIRAVDQADWWHDCQERFWIVKRPFHPGVIDSTHLFEVTYRIDGKEVARWSVDTRRRSVEELKLGP
jgi:RNA polymerase sigma-70 factor (ECF subfamily)